MSITGLPVDEDKNERPRFPPQLTFPLSINMATLLSLVFFWGFLCAKKLLIEQDFFQQEKEQATECRLYMI